jgi:hypothetical protein
LRAGGAPLDPRPQHGNIARRSILEETPGQFSAKSTSAPSGEK